jgi:hypothetical protein
MLYTGGGGGGWVGRGVSVHSLKNVYKLLNRKPIKLKKVDPSPPKKKQQKQFTIPYPYTLLILNLCASLPQLFFNANCL